MSAPAPAGGAERAPAPALRMRSLLLSWAVLALVWTLGQLLVDLLVLHRVELTASALWTATLVPATQALALESLAAPLGLGTFLARAARSLRRPALLALWLLCGAAVLAARFTTAAGAALLGTAAALLALLAALLLASAAWRAGELAPARPALVALAVLLVLAAANRVLPWLVLLPGWLLPRWPPRAARFLLGGLLVATLFGALFRLQRRLAGRRDTAAGWLGAAAGVGALGLAASLLPLRLTTSVRDAPPLAGAILLLLVAACLASSAICLAGAREER